MREARSIFEEVTAVEPANVSAHKGLAQAAYRLGESDVAEQAYRRLLQLDPDSWQALNDLAWILAHDRGEDGLSEAAALANRGLSLQPDNAHLLDTRGVILLKLGRLEEARRDLEKCVRLSGGQQVTLAKALFHLGQALARITGEGGAARAALENANGIDETHKVFSAEERAEIARLLEVL
jgi:Flp pilus assembly protein TadD